MSRLFLRRMASRKRLADQFIELGIQRGQSVLESGRPRRWRIVHRCECRAKYPRLQGRIEPRQLPPVSSQVVALAVERPTQQALSQHPPQVVAGLPGAILLPGQSEQRGHLAAQSPIAQSLDDAGKLAKHQRVNSKRTGLPGKGRALKAKAFS